MKTESYVALTIQNCHLGYSFLPDNRSVLHSRRADIANSYKRQTACRRFHSLELSRNAESADDDDKDENLNTTLRRRFKNDTNKIRKCKKGDDLRASVPKPLVPSGGLPPDDACSGVGDRSIMTENKEPITDERPSM